MIKFQKKTLKLFKLYTRGNWFYLFHALIVLLLIYPYIQQSELVQKHWILYIIDAFVILSIIYEASFNLIQLILALIFGVVILGIYWLPFSESRVLTQFILHSGLYLYAIIILISSLVKIKKADTETIYGTISLYILLGLLWTNIYQIISIITPDAFSFSHQALKKHLIWSDYLYFSFVTLTTLGYGDITPHAPMARSFAIIEAITGVLFIAVMVSKTIGLYVVHLKSQIQQKQQTQEKK